MKLVKVNEGSTFFNEEYNEVYNFGNPYENASKYYGKHVKDGYSILDIGFGLGYNTLASLIKGRKLRIVCLENDRKILKEIKNLTLNEDIVGAHEIIRKLVHGLDYNDENYDLKLMVGDARINIRKIKEKFDLVFLDGFSVVKNPELWSVDFLGEIKKCLKEEGKLISYSNSVIFRKCLLEAGFKVGYNEDGTIGSLKEELGLNEKDLKLVNAFGVALRDQGLRSTREELIEQIKKRLYF